MQQVATQPYAREISSSLLRRSVFLAQGYERLKLEPDSSCSWFYSKRAEKALYGRESTELYKFQAGVRIGTSQREQAVRVSPSQLLFSSRPFDGVYLTQAIAICSSKSVGYARTMRLVNRSGGHVKLRLITSHDPTSLNFRKETDPPGEIGVNAFNRGGHVVMDDVGDTTGVRVLATIPIPSLVYMTRERQRASDLLAQGELPENTAGISGPIIILTQHDVDLSPGATAEVRLISLYNPSKLEEALMDLNAITTEGGAELPPSETETHFACSVPSINFSFAWAKARMDSMEQETDSLNLLFSASALKSLRPKLFRERVEQLRSAQRRDGFLQHSLDPARAGVLETSQFLIAVCEHLLLQADRKLSRTYGSALRRAADSLLRASTDGLVACDSTLPQGWRRRLKAGYPSGVITEVNLAVARALKAYASFASSTGKGNDSSKYSERSEKVVSSVKERLRDDENGMVLLNTDALGRKHKEVTVDAAISLAYLQFDRALVSSLVHRLLEKDFETGWGPRTVPSSNPLYFSSSYGEGELGGYCTRAALVHAMLAYLAGYPEIGSAQLEKVAKLVYSDCERMGGIPGEFPYWLDPDRRVVASQGSDPVAASRFLDAIVYGELGLAIGASTSEFRPPESSRLRWLLIHRAHFGSLGSVFVGRGNGRLHGASSLARVAFKDGTRFTDCERLQTNISSLECLHFFGPGQLLCVGNVSGSECSSAFQVPLRDRSLSKSLFARLMEVDHDSGKWVSGENVRVSDRLTIRVSVGANSWTMLRLSRITT